MNQDNERIRRAVTRNAKALELKPSIGQSTGRTVVRLGDGLSCEIEEGPWRLTAGMPESSGGDNLGPDPGMFGRGALATCLAFGYAMEAAKRGVDIRGLEIEVEADYDARGFYGLADVPPGYLDVRFHVAVETDAAEEVVLDLLDQAEAHSPWLDVFRTALNPVREATVTRPA